MTALIALTALTALTAFITHALSVLTNILQHLDLDLDLDLGGDGGTFTFTAMLASLVQTTHSHSHASQTHAHVHSRPKDAFVGVTIKPIASPDRTMDDLLQEVQGLFEAPLLAANLHSLSGQLQEEFRQKMQASKISMLPSFHHAVPTGHEKGTILSLDVGGSTFRVALVELSGRHDHDMIKQESGVTIKTIKCFAIDNYVRSLHGKEFFDWMAERIQQVLVESRIPATKKLPMALAWSFPIEQTSTRSGTLLAMGKGFLATHGAQGKDLCDLVMTSCLQRKLNVQLTAIVNDSSAALLSQAYRDTQTRFSLILGTGINSAIYLPLDVLAREKYGMRPQEWWQVAEQVLVNTELSTFGKKVWPTSRWDDDLNACHALPDFQPLEHMVSGRYLGEILRLILVEAIDTAGLFAGEIPQGLDEPYRLDTGLAAVFESDASPCLATASAAFQKAHPLSSARIPSQSDLHFIRHVSRLVSSRAAAYVATAVHALWSLQRASSPALAARSVTIACNGSVMEKYPEFRRRCQGLLDQLVELSAQAEGQRDGVVPVSVRIEMAEESSIIGAAVAAASEADVESAAAAAAAAAAGVAVNGDGRRFP